jgi:hypothetical protein
VVEAGAIGQPLDREHVVVGEVLDPGIRAQ